MVYIYIYIYIYIYMSVCVCVCVLIMKNNGQLCRFTRTKSDVVMHSYYRHPILHYFTQMETFVLMYRVLFVFELFQKLILIILDWVKGVVQEWYFDSIFVQICGHRYTGTMVPNTSKNLMYMRLKFQFISNNILLYPHPYNAIFFLHHTQNMISYI